MIPLCIPNLVGNEKKYLNECIDSSFVSSVGPFVARLEEAVAQSAGVPYAVATSAGTTALHIALVACGVGRDDLVLMPSYTFIATANAVSHCGALPYLVDIDQKDWTIDVELLRHVLQEETESKEGRLIHRGTGRRIAAIMPVYTLGNVAEMQNISNLAKQYHLPVIADAAAAIGATYRGRKLGELATATVFSFNGNKTVTSGGGGAVVTKDQELAQTIRHMLSTARIGVEYTHDMVGYNYRMTNIEAAVGLAQMENLKQFIDQKRKIRKLYQKGLGDISELGFFPDQKGESVDWFSGIVLKDAGEVDRMCVLLYDKGIEARAFWKPMHLQLPYKDCPKTSMRCCDDLWDRVLTLPCSTGITEKELDYVVRTVRAGMGG